MSSKILFQYIHVKYVGKELENQWSFVNNSTKYINQLTNIKKHAIISNALKE